MTAPEEQVQGDPAEPLRLRLARLRASLWRFRTLDFSQRLFAGGPEHQVLSRPFCGRRLFVDVSRSNAQRLLYLEGERFLAERFLLRRRLRPGDQVVDVGANIGYYMLLFRQLVGDAGRIHCFEPEPENVIELRRNVRRNRLDGVDVHPVAAGDADGRISLHAGINGKVAPDGTGSLTVDLRRLDSVLSHRVDLMKIDVEGYEGHVLAGAEGLLAAYRPALFVEVHPAFLAPPTSLDGIFARLRAYDPGVSVFTGASHRSLLEKIVSRYRPGAGVSRVLDLPRFLAACRAGTWTEPFWAVCDPRRAERS
jgi:FkbM family methyltransferase